MKVGNNVWRKFRPCGRDYSKSESYTGRVKDTFTDSHRRVVASLITLICNNVAMIITCTRIIVEGYRINPHFFSSTEVNIKYLGKYGRDLKYIHPEYRGADKSLDRPGRKQARKHVRDACDFNKIETRAVIKFFFSARQGAEGNSRHSDRNISLFHSW